MISLITDYDKTVGVVYELSKFIGICLPFVELIVFYLISFSFSSST